MWNQLCPFTSAPIITNATWTDNTLLATAKNGQVYWNAPEKSIIAGHKYIQIATLKTTAAAGQVRAFSLGELINLYNVAASGSYQVLAGIATNSGTLRAIAIRDTRESDWDAIEVAGVILTDLTQMFGSDEQIAAALGVTVAEITTDKAVQAFERLFPEPYYPHCEGRLVNLGGYDIKWNQLVQNGDFSDGTTRWTVDNGCTLAVNNNVLTVTMTGDRATFHTTTLEKFKIGHKYYYSSDVAGSGLTGFIVVQYGANFQTIVTSDPFPPTRISSIITSAMTPENKNLYYVIYGESGSTLQLRNVNLIDLTEMFGPGSEPTLKEFEAMFPDDYYEYNAGTEMNILDAATGENKLELGSVGFNQWDEEWEVGILGSGGGKTNGNGLICKNFISVFPSTTYYGKTPRKFRAIEYDENYNFTKIVVGGVYNSTFTTSSKTHYLKFGDLSNQSGTINYNHDICINLSDSNRNGTYEPYKQDTLDLDWIRNEGVENFNIWDEEWEVGVYNLTNGTPVSGINAVRCKNAIPCFPNTQYYIQSLYDSYWRILFYDSNNNFISPYKEYSTNGNSNIIITPTNAEYIKFYMAISYGTTYNHDICINLSNPALNGEYYPYGEKAKYFPQGLLSAGSVHDEVTETKLIKRIGTVDLGTLGWTKTTTEVADVTCFMSSLPNASFINAVCVKYDFAGPARIYLASIDKAFAPYNSGSSKNVILIRDSTYDNYDATTFKAAMSGVPLYYELATPVEIPISTPHRLTYRANKYCTEEILPRPIPGSSPLSSSIIADITYQNK